MQVTPWRLHGPADHQGTVMSGWLLINTCGGSRRASSSLRSKSASGGACARVVALLLLLLAIRLPARGS